MIHRCKTSCPTRYPGQVDTAPLRLPRRHESRPGRHPLVAETLTELQGPTSGTVELPHHLLWRPGRTVDLSDPWTLEWTYANVLREAVQVEDLRAYLDGATLQRLWPKLNLPRGVRRAWEERHPHLHQVQAAA